MQALTVLHARMDSPDTRIATCLANLKASPAQGTGWVSRLEECAAASAVAPGTVAIVMSAHRSLTQPPDVLVVLPDI